MKLSKTLLRTILVAVTVGTMSSCEKATVGEEKKVATENPKSGGNTQASESSPEGCPACGMG
ncbi:MAG: hypothetical protein ABIR81_01620 [Ginsengibacter sp.]